ncbi:hypothetical protein SDC9_88119 [bioreactor metagenome]|uniref:Uncharacterized protein n=1 Tax=bioreactor metagenome TaxID=1076179 RepID=A0A644ZV43_9ZZZZ
MQIMISYLIGDILRIWALIHIKSKRIVFSFQIGNIKISKLLIDKGCELSAGLWVLHVGPSV